MLKRPPIVVVMGHVDHGKTTLLDYIRKTNIATKEAGGITQSIGAYEIEVRPKDEPKSRESEANRGIPREARAIGSEAQARRDDFANVRKITFIDTPGHEAFSNMRYHGARAADLAILVVAADDGVKPQTKDALKHILEEKLPFVVAINKVDKPGADIEKVKLDLGKAGVYLEGFGGNVSWHAISAKNGEGIKELLDLVLLTAEVEDLKYDSDVPASGVVTSVRLEPQKGIIVGVLIENGKLVPGKFISTESASGKIKVIEDFLGRRAESLVPSSPALIYGFNELPKIGEEFIIGEELKKPSILKKEEGEAKPIKASDDKTLAVILKADEAGSLEALKNLVVSIAAEFSLNIVASSVGQIHESDIKQAESTKALVLGFRVKTGPAAVNLARARKITVINSKIIYELEKSLKDYSAKVILKDVRSIEILAVFGKPKGKEKVIGGRVVLGPVKSQESFEIWSDKTLIGAGRIINLQSGRKDVLEAEANQEVGLLVETEEPIKVGHRLVFP